MILNIELQFIAKAMEGQHTETPEAAAAAATGIEVDVE